MGDFSVVTARLFIHRTCTDQDSGNYPVKDFMPKLSDNSDDPQVIAAFAHQPTTAQQGS